jgi:hypothetical protein
MGHDPFRHQVPARCVAPHCRVVGRRHREHAALKSSGWVEDAGPSESYRLSSR